MEEGKVDDQRVAYQILDVKYVKAMGREVSWDPEVNSDLYPNDWFSNMNYAQKANILAEAIEKKCLIRETEAYLNIIEGVKTEKKNRK